jgi:hypothetical protein
VNNFGDRKIFWYLSPSEWSDASKRCPQNTVTKPDAQLWTHDLERFFSVWEKFLFIQTRSCIIITVITNKPKALNHKGNIFY